MSENNGMQDMTRVDQTKPIALTLTLFISIMVPGLVALGTTLGFIYNEGIARDIALEEKIQSVDERHVQYNVRMWDQFNPLKDAVTDMRAKMGALEPRLSSIETGIQTLIQLERRRYELLETQILSQQNNKKED